MPQRTDRRIMDTKTLIDKLHRERALSGEEWVRVIDGRTPQAAEHLFRLAREVRQAVYGKDVYIRGLIEFTNYCRNDCYYCGIRKSNPHVQRYRLSQDQILDCCRQGYELGFRTFVLQGGEDGWFTDERMVCLIRSIKAGFPDCALTLSIGERGHDSYQAFFDAGADRYLLRHETSSSDHYRKLHPPSLSAAHRKACLLDLKSIGYQVGAGFMVGSPFQETRHLAEDMLFLKELRPHMVGIGPFIPHRDTPFAGKQAGTLELTLYMLGLLRLMLPDVLLPATTALGSICEGGRELGILAGANVVMPNLSPRGHRKDYSLYDNKLNTGAESAEGLADLSRRVEQTGCHVAVCRGDWRPCPDQS
ncbi:[FeFe] hydrogenase H-cluster radical SAM maturase HydE [Lachnoclostridium sp. An118]|nr:[FeFe] hydrogenase H-cluster radical SAM maturase HydE [Lachnoclostridium sp. An118]